MLWGLHPGFHADQVADVFAQTLIEPHQKIDGRDRHAADPIQIRLELGRQRQLLQVRAELVLFVLAIGEGGFVSVGLEKEIERVEDRHFSDKIDFDTEFRGFFREYQTRQIVALGILLPVGEMLFGQHFERIGEYAGAAMGRWTQTNDLRAKLDGPVIAVVRDVVQRDMYRHSVPPANLNVIRAAQDLCHTAKAGHCASTRPGTAPKRRRAQSSRASVAQKRGRRVVSRRKYVSRRKLHGQSPAPQVFDVCGSRALPAKSLPD